MRNKLLPLIVCVFTLLPMGEITMAEEERISLPEANQQGEKSVEEALAERRSVREYAPGAISLAELAQLLWAAQGITGSLERKTAPSAGGLFPLEVYAVVGKVEGLSAGVYKYDPAHHALVNTMQGDIRTQLATAALGQTWVKEAPVVIAITAVYAHTTKKYRERGIRYVHMEVGHVAQNIYLQAETLGLGTVVVGAFEDSRVQQALDLPKEQEPLCLMPVGRK